MEQARLVLDERQTIEEIALQYGFIAEESARIYREEIQALLIDSDDPAAAGGPPHSEGRLRDSFFSTRARRRGDQIRAYTSSNLLAEDIPLPLAVLLDEGWQDGGPFPFLDQAELNARRRVAELLQRTGSR